MNQKDYKEIARNELKITNLGLLGSDRKRTKIEESKLNECRQLFKEGKLTIEEGHRIMNKLMIKEDKRLGFNRQQFLKECGVK